MSIDDVETLSKSLITLIKKEDYTDFVGQGFRASTKESPSLYSLPSRAGEFISSPLVGDG
jgi:hypothetical protein